MRCPATGLFTGFWVAFCGTANDLTEDKISFQDVKIKKPIRQIRKPLADYQRVTEPILVPRRFQWYIAEGMLSLPTAKWSMVISFFSGVMASGFAFGCAKDTVEFFNAGIGEVRFPVGEGFLLVIFDYVGPWV